MANFFDQFDAPSSSGNFFDQFDEKPEAPKPEKPGLIRSLADVALEIPAGAANATKALADAFGAGSEVSRSLGNTAEMYQGMQSPARQAERQAQAQRSLAAEQSGSTWEEVKAAGQNFFESPVSASAGAAGSLVPIVAGGLIASRLGVKPTVATGALSGGMGAGAVKGSIYDDQLKRAQEAGLSPEQAQAKATAAQAYSGPNTDQIALGAGLGVLAGSTGVERVLGGATSGIKSLVGRIGAGAVQEALPEAAQGGQERLAANVAAQRAGYDASTWQGVAGQATSEGLASAAPGSLSGGMTRYAPPVDPNAGPLSRAAATAQQTGAAGLAQAAQQAQAAEGDTQAAQPDVDPLAGLSARLTPEAMRAVRAAEGYGPESVNEVLRAYQIARNPELDPTIRQQATEALNGFWQGFDNRPNWTRPNPQPEQAPQPGTDVVPFGQGTDVAAPGVVPPFDPNTLDGEAQEVGTLPPNRPLLTGPEEVAQQYRRDLLEEVLADPDTRNPLSRYESVLKKNGFEQRRATPDERKLIEDRTVSRTETVPARAELPSFAAVEQSRRAAFPMTQTGAQRQAAERTQATGQAFEVVPHPTVKGRFAVQAVESRGNDQLLAGAPQGAQPRTAAPDSYNGQSGRDLRQARSDLDSSSLDTSSLNDSAPVAAANTSPERVTETPEIEQVAPTNALLNSGEISTPAKSRQAELRAKMEADQATSAEIDEYISLVDQEFAVRRSGGKAQADQWFETPERARSFLTESGYQERNGAFEKDGEQRVRIAPQSTGRGGVALELDEFAPDVEDSIAEAAKLAGRTEKETRSIYRNMVEKNGKEYADDLLRKTVEKFRTQGTANEKAPEALPSAQERGTAQQAEVTNAQTQSTRDANNANVSAGMDALPKEPALVQPGTVAQGADVQAAVTQASRPQGVQEGAQESGQGVDDLRAKLQAVERDILAAAPPKFSVGGGDIEGAMRSLKVPKALKEQRKALKEQIRTAQQPRSDLDTVAERVTEPTHADPGQAPEAATAPVIREAIQKSARNTPLDVKQAKATLLADIDRAMANVPTENAELAAELAQEKARKFKLSDRVAKLGKGSIRDKLEREEGAAFDAMQADRIAKTARQIGFVTFDVPGDGKFKVVNTVEAIEAFRDKVKASPGFREDPTTGMKLDPRPAGPTKKEQSDAITKAVKEGRRSEALDDLGNAIEIARLHGANDDPLMERFREIADKDYDAWRAEQDAEGEIAAREAGQSATPNSPEPRAEQGQQADTGTDKIKRSFAGESARTADTHALATAQSRIAAGEDAETVQQETGWFRGADNRWRFEIDDSDATLKPKFWTLRLAVMDGDENKSYALATILDHPKLFAAYPFLRETRVFGETVKSRGGVYFADGEGSGHVAINLDNMHDPDQAMSVLLHEIQHALQDREGFALGSSEGAANKSNREYWNDAGETEARNTESRQKLTAAERRAQSPESTADVKAPDVIVVFNGTEMASAPAPANAAPMEATGTTPDAIWSAVESLVGPIRKRRIVVVQSAEVLVEQGILQSRDANGAQAFVKDGKAYFIASNIQPGNERAVFLHEVGAHLGMERILSPLQRSVLLNRIKTWAAQANGSVESRIAKAALRRVEAAGVTGTDADAELIAYAVEEAVKAGINPTTDTAGPIGKWFKTLWAALRTALEKLGLVNASKLTAQDVVNLAQGAAHVAMSEDATGGDVQFSADRSALLPDRAEAEAYRSSLSAALASLKSNVAPIKVMTTPRVLRMLGANDLPITISRDVVRKATNAIKHDVTMEAIERLPEELANPVMVFESATQPGDLVVLTEYRDKSGRPVMVAVNLNVQADKKGYTINRVSSAYGRGAAEYMGFMERGLLRYRNTAKSPDWLSDNGLQLPNSLSTSRGSWDSVPTEADAVNWQSDPRIQFSRAASTIAPVWDVPESSKLFNRFDTDSLLYTLQDKHVDTKRVVEAIRKQSGDIADEFNPYLQEELFHGRSAKGVKDFLDSELRPLLTEMSLRKVDMATLEKFLHARHAEERNIQIAKINPKMPDGGSGMNTQEARDYLAALDPAQKALLDKLAARIDAINASTRQVLVDAGLEKPETIKAWEGAYKHYVPLQREEVDSGGLGIGQGFSVKGSASKRAMGSDKAVADIIANIAMQRERAIVRAEKNRVSQALYALALKAPNPEFWMPINPAEAQAFTPKQQQTVIDELTSMGLDPADAMNFVKEPKQRYIDPRTGLVSERINPVMRSAPNVLATRINGEDRYVFFNSGDERANRMVHALKNLDADQLGRMLQTSAKLTRWFASVNTQYNPVFGAINLTRDVQGAILNLSTTPIRGQEAKVLANTFSALKGIYTDLRAIRKGGAASSQWAGLWEEFQKEGGQTGYRDMFSNATERAEAIQKELDQLGEGKLKAGGRALFDWLSDYNESMENAVRLAAYKAAKDQGISTQQAASIAKNLTVNFNRKGQITTQAGALYAFFNAAVQGTARMAQTLNGPAGRKIILGGLTLGAMQAVLLAAAGFDDEDPPEFVRERSIIIPTGGGKYISIPMPLGFHVIPSTSRILTEWALSGFKHTPKRFSDVLSLFADTFNPIGNAGWSMQTLAPTALDPLAALAENRDWSGKPIAREDFNKMAPTPGYSRAKDTASWVSKQMAYWFNLGTGGTDYKPGMFSPTPDQLDYLIGQFTGGVGREYLKAEQTATSVWTGEDLPPHKIPLLGRFYGDTTGQSSEANRFYSNIKEVNQHKLEIDGRRKDGGDVGEYMRDNPTARLAMVTSRFETTVRKLRQARRDAVERGDSQERIKALDAQMTNVMRQFNEQFARLDE